MTTALPFLVAMASCFAAQVRAQTTRPASVDSALWEQLLAVDKLAQGIGDLTSHFEQEKLTPMLKRPLLSSGTVRVKGSTMRWDTSMPEPSIIFADEREFRIYYPSQKMLEIYPIDKRLASLAASPLPSLSVLVQHFNFVEIDTKLIDQSAMPDETIALRMTPASGILKEHVEAVRVLLKKRQGVITLFELTDTDGDKTTIRFSDTRENTGLTESELALKLPADVKISKPLEGLGDSPPPTR